MLQFILNFLKNFGKSEIEIKIEEIFEDKEIDSAKIYNHLFEVKKQLILENKDSLNKFNKPIIEFLKDFFEQEASFYNMDLGIVQILDSIKNESSAIEKERRIIDYLDKFFFKKKSTSSYINFIKENPKNSSKEELSNNLPKNREKKIAWDASPPSNTHKKEISFLKKRKIKPL